VTGSWDARAAWIRIERKAQRADTSSRRGPAYPRKRSVPPGAIPHTAKRGHVVRAYEKSPADPNRLAASRRRDRGPGPTGLRAVQRGSSGANSAPGFGPRRSSQRSAAEELQAV